MPADGTSEVGTGMTPQEEAVMRASDPSARFPGDASRGSGEKVDPRSPGNQAKIDQIVQNRQTTEAQPPDSLASRGVGVDQATLDRVTKDLKTVQESVGDGKQTSPETTPPATEQKSGFSASLKQKLGAFMNKGNKPH